MHLFYDPNITTDTKSFILNEEESGHACRVLRMRVGNSLFLLDGKGNRYTCVISDPHPKKCQVDVTSVFTEIDKEPEIHLAIAPTKNMERIEWLTEKITELGVTQITLLLCRNNERKQVKLERLQRILVSAMKQSQRLFLPILNDLTPLNTFVSENPNGLIAHCHEGNKSTLQELIADNQGPLLIGPEGDFTREEVELALQNGYKSITLGKNRLRTETAGLLVCAAAVLNKTVQE